MDIYILKYVLPDNWCTEYERYFQTYHGCEQAAREIFNKWKAQDKWDLKAEDVKFEDFFDNSDVLRYTVVDLEN